MFTKNHIIINLEANEKIDILKEITERAINIGIVKDRDQLLVDLLNREEESCTGIHQGVAIPHAKSVAVLTPSIIFISLKKEVEWESLDGIPIKNVFALLAPALDQSNSHLLMLSKLATELMEDEFIEKINLIESVDNAYKIISNIFEGEE